MDVGTKRTLTLDVTQERALKNALTREWNHLRDVLDGMHRTDTAREFMYEQIRAIEEIQSQFLR